MAALRDADALSISLVAHGTEALVGLIAFSPVTVSDGAPGWYGLGPVCVAPSRQRQGIGRALVECGLAALRAHGARGCVVLGEPAFYQRFGFVHDSGLVLAGAPSGYFQSLVFGPGSRARGSVAYHFAFFVSPGTRRIDDTN